MSRNESNIIHSHAGLRGVAASFVMIFHYLLYAIREGFCPLAEREHLIRVAWIAVDLFFILSGFILCWVYWKPSKGVDWKGYLVARVARICPLYYGTLLVACLLITYSYFRHGLEHVGAHNFIKAFFANIFMASGVLDIPTFNGPAWSISVEFFCYLAVFPLLVFLNAKLMGKFPSPVKNLVFFGMILIAMLGLHWCILNQQFIYHGWNPVWLLRGIMGFITGFSLCILFRKIPKAFQFPWMVKSLSVISAGVICAGLIHCLPIGFIIYFMPLLVISVAYDIGPISRILSTKIFQFLGKLSYGIYMWHMLLLVSFPKGLSIALKYAPHYIRENDIIRLLLYISIVLFVAVFSYHWIEVPARRWIRSSFC